MHQDKKTEGGLRLVGCAPHTISGRRGLLVCDAHPTISYSLPSVPRRGGFTFVELLVTMVLISVLLPVVMQTIGLCTRLAGQSRRQIEAACLARTKLTELTASQDWENGSSRGDFGTDWPGYEWTTALATWAEDASLHQLELTVSWRSMGKQRGITLSTLVYSQEQ